MQKPEFASLFRPHRQPREMLRGVGTVFFTAAIDDRKKAFGADEVVLPCVNALTKCFRKVLCRCDAYCFMPDHLHVLATGMIGGSDAWLGMVTFKQQTGRLLRQHGFSWQLSFVPRAMEPNRSTEVVALYILNNPVRAGLVGAWQDYPYSGRADFEHWGYKV